MTTLFRIPLVTAIPKRPVLAADTSFRNAVLLAALVVATPFHQTDWPNPVRARAAPAPEVTYNLLARAQQLALPLNAIQDWPIPSRPKPISTENPPNLLTGTLAPHGVPFYQTDWPTPIRPALKNYPQFYRQVGTGAAPPPVTAPFSQNDWVTPAAARLQRFDDAPNVAIRLPITAVAKPFANLDWPQISWRRDSSESMVLESVTYSPVPAPFFQTDWQNPTARKPQRIDDPPNLISGTLKPAAGKPFYTVDQATPQQRRAALQVDPVPNALILGIPVFTLAPFAQSDWPLVGRARFAAAIDTPYNLLVQAQQAGGPLIALQDWSMPPVRRYAQVDVSPNLVISRLIGASVPFAPIDWPNPTARKGVAYGFEFSVGALYIPKPPVLPHALYDWPNPVRARAGDPSDTVENLLIDIGKPLITQRGGPRYIVRRQVGRGFTVSRQTGRNFLVSALMSLRFDTKDPLEAIKLTFDFTPDLLKLPNVLLQGVPVVTVFAVTLGVDPNPNAIFNGVASLDPTSTKVIVPVIAGLSGCDYKLKCEIATTDPLTILELNGLLPVRS